MTRDERWAVVTGAAGGIGLACARALRDAGYAILATDLLPATTPAEEGFTWRDLDVTDAAAVQALADELSGSGRAPDVLINSAGLLQDILRLEDLPDEQHRRIWEVNYWGTYYASRSFGLAMAERGSGSIVNLSSINALRSTPLLGYAPGKAAINALTEGLAAELGPRGVRVNAIAPGFTLTPILKGKIEAGLRDPSRILAATALRRFVEPEDIGAAAAFLCSDAARCITGICLPVDAGWIASVSRLSFGAPASEG